MNAMIVEMVCRDCGGFYYLAGRSALRDTGRCVKCDIEVRELEEKYGREAEWKAFLRVIGVLTVVALAYWGILISARYLWRLL